VSGSLFTVASNEFLVGGKKKAEYQINSVLEWRS
jgi:hypothetical protein